MPNKKIGDDKLNKNNLTPLQLQMIAELINNNGNKTLACKQLNVNRTTLYNWLDDDLFFQEYKAACNKLYAEHLADAINGIVDIATTGAGRDRIAACRTLLQLNGYLDTKLDISQNTKQTIEVTLFNSEDNSTDKE